LSGLAYIPTCRSPSPQIVYNTGRHRASGGLFITRSAKSGNDLADSDIYHPAKFHRSTPTHARDIRYQNSCGHTNRKTVTDIPPACLSACGDNKYAGPTSVERVIDFSIFDLGCLPLCQRSPKGEMTYCPPRSSIPQNFSPIAQTVFEICVTEVVQSLALIFDPSRSSKVKFDDGNRQPVGPTYKCSLGSNVVSVTVFEIFRVKILTMTF